MGTASAIGERTESAVIYLIVMTLLNIAATAGIHLAIHRPRFGQLEERKRQILIGLLYGLLACAATEFGSVQYGSVTNIRDAMPMTAGLLFGGQAFWRALSVAFTAGSRLIGAVDSILEWPAPCPPSSPDTRRR